MSRTRESDSKNLEVESRLKESRLAFYYESPIMNRIRNFRGIAPLLGLPMGMRMGKIAAGDAGTILSC